VLCKEASSTEKATGIALEIKLINEANEANEANDQMQDETTKLLHAWIPKEEGSPSISILCW
jgi:hypothetical protein